MEQSKSMGMNCYQNLFNKFSIQSTKTIKSYDKDEIIFEKKAFYLIQSRFWDIRLTFFKLQIENEKKRNQNKTDSKTVVELINKVEQQGMRNNNK